MNLDRFLSDRRAAWDELERSVTAARGRPERLGARGVRRVGSLYRSAAADLALARRRWPHDPMTARLEALVASARALVYDSEPRRVSLRAFFGRVYWHRVAERPRMIAFAWALLVVPALLAILWAQADPGHAVGLVPAQMRPAIDPPSAGANIPAPAQAAFSTFIFTNNIRVTFLAFAGGIAAGLGTAFVVIYNGTILGAVGGLAFQAGNGMDFVRLVTAHGVLELSCIAVSAAAGLRLGWAMISPGALTRAQSLVAEARPAMEIILGTAPWLIVAGLVEGFITPSRYPLGVVLGVGFGLAALYWTLVWRLGRVTAEPALSP